MVGASLACALEGHGLRCLLVESGAFRADRAPASFDDRAIALSAGSLSIFQQLGLRAALDPMLTPIQQVHVSEAGQAGIVHLDADAADLTELGGVVTAPNLGHLFAERLPTLQDTTLVNDSRFESLNIAADKVSLNINGETISASLVIAADGANSSVRQSLGVEVREHDHAQSAIVTNVGLGRAHRGVAYERFTADGPLAVLPMSEQRSAIVMTLSRAAAEQAMTQDDTAFLERLQSAFGWRLGRLHRVGKRASFPLKSVFSSEQVRPRAVILGNAAHSLHPIGGQGFNLSLRDVSVLAELLTRREPGTDVGAPGLLARYQQLRGDDQQIVRSFTDGLERAFAQRLPGAPQARCLGMIGLELLPPGKRWLAHQAMGLGKAARGSAREQAAAPW